MTVIIPPNNTVFLSRKHHTFSVPMKRFCVYLTQDDAMGEVRNKTGVTFLQPCLKTVIFSGLRPYSLADG